ncbi:MAG: hypothetical protein AVDCRST_MAG83-858 [uncultured Arthrobacter sp.]|uniref:Uncharacterized protein n=1 Tax=uncultured Arthrobacter sp. TaxID=114050 RepID=A0A6J4HKH1_9MICC|nr:hypothetical protein [uncultured Arthrobacter sp.]CAA9225928.1 MAG: hypothetical protein AVDCRST_MAG83-858 [uncultured Arthrobacter sp.]
MMLRIRRVLSRPVLVAAVAGSLALAGCGAPGSLDAEAARQLSASVREIAGLAAAGNTQAALDRADALRQEVEASAADGAMSEDRAALISARIDAVVASLQEAGEEPTPSASTTPPAGPAPAPATSAAPPAPVVPAPVEPAPVEPAPVEPSPIEPSPVEPSPAAPEPEAPEPAEPAPEEPKPEEPAPEEPKPEEPKEDPGKDDEKDEGAGKGNDDPGKGKSEEKKDG